MIKAFGKALVWDMGRRIAARRGFLGYSAGYMMRGSFCVIHHMEDSCAGL
jgi:hypothetical protein